MEKTAKVLAAGAGHLYGTSLPVGGTNTHAVISAHTGYDRLMFDRLSLGQGHVGDRFTIEVLGTRWRIGSPTFVSSTLMISVCSASRRARTR